MSALLQHSTDLVALCDAEGRITYTSPSVTRLLGYQPEELRGSLCFDLLHPDDHARVAASFAAKTLSRAENAPVEMRLRHRNGAWRTMEATSTNLLSDPLVRCMVVNAHDITERVEAERAYREGEARFRSLIEAANMGILAVNQRGLVTLVNGFGAALFGYAPEELIGQPIELLIDEGLRAKHAELREHSFEQNHGRLFARGIELHGLHKDGTSIAIDASIGFFQQDGERQAVVCVTDITDRLRKAERLRLLESVVVNANDGVMVTDAGALDGPDPRIVYVNEALLRQTGYSADEVVGQTPRIFQGPGTDPEAIRAIRSALAAHEPVYVEVLSYTKGGEELWVELSIAPVYGDSGAPTHFIAIQRDVTAHKRVELQRRELSAALAHQARYDALTGLPNRYMFDDRMQQAIAEAARTDSELALFFIDLDNFKHLNDTLGHPVGDALLGQIVARLTPHVPPGATLARWGGDEFSVIVPGVGRRAQVIAIGRQLLGALEAPFTLQARELFITASVGISCYPRDGDDATTLLRHADSAMYRAKASGRNAVQCYAPEMSDRALLRLDLEHALRGALARREFVLHYQPKINAATREVTGLEALLRWQHPERGLVPPAEFIPLAEENGMIVSLGGWVLEECCRQAATWRDMGLPPVRIAVNVSALQFERDDFVEQVATLLTRHELAPEWLELEVTEGVVMQDIEKVVRRLGALRDLGLWVSIDDFGSGYSSLSYLRRMPVDILKIDRSFVRDLSRTAQDMRDPIALLEAIITLAHALKLVVVAEGVETDEQFALLREMGCDHMQGYLFARPMPAERILALLRGEGGVLMV
jgi:diguanylate cyclase (GGDEF)-like protein/PAS domain S-box-containing protein